MFDTLQKIISKIDADYADIRYETEVKTIIEFRSGMLTEYGTNLTDGYVMRVLKDGGIASATFTKASEADDIIQCVTEHANLLGQHLDKPVKLAQTEVNRDNVIPIMAEDPRKIPIMEKLEIIRQYNDIPLRHEHVATTWTSYNEVIREKYFVNTEGSQIREDLITTRVFGVITTKGGNFTQNVFVGDVRHDGFSHLRNLHEQFQERTALAADLLRATPVKGGVYNCILNPDLAAAFIHEGFGHYSEADCLEALPSMQQKMRIGAKLGSDVLSIVDDTAQIANGLYKYDDEGVKVRRIQLMKNGILTGRLHSRRTAYVFNEPVSGHCVAQNYRQVPIIRMGNIFIDRGNCAVEDLLDMVGDGLYLVGATYGQTMGEEFTFGSQYGYIIENGKKTKMVRDINISGNLYTALKNIKAVGNDLAFRLGPCGKVGQYSDRIGAGAPHILVENLIVGGS